MVALIWPAILAYPNLAYVVEVLSQFGKNSGSANVELVKYFLQYLSETLDLDPASDKEIDTLDDIVGYIDFNFIGSKIDQKSTEDYIFILVEFTINHLSEL